MIRIPTDKEGKEIAPPPVKICEQMDSQRREYQLITPLFGGGVTPGVADPITPIRAPGIRGHLRFWWRATRGGRFGGDLAAMKAAEDQIWGAAATKNGGGPSGVQISVKIIAQGTEKDLFSDNSWRTIQYVAFPLREESKKVLEGVSFVLNLVFPAEFRKDIESALWAWETFGGVGARTRRGFGALKLKKIGDKPFEPPPSSELEGWISDKLSDYLTDGKSEKDLKWPEGVPHLLPSMLSTRSSQKAPSETPNFIRPHLVITRRRDKVLQAWEDLVSKLLQFRQSRNGRKASLWPEPHIIRDIVKNSKGAIHSARFPRAQLGLPIEFLFKDEDIDVFLEARVPQNGSGLSGGRMASPVILRPLALKDGAVGLALAVGRVRMPPYGIMLKGYPGVSADASLTDSEAKKVAPLKGDPDVIEAFLKSLK